MANDKKTLELRIKIAADEALAAVEAVKSEVQSLSGEFQRFAGSDGKALGGVFHSTQTAAEKAAASMKLFGAQGNDLRNVQAQLKSAAVELTTRGFDPQSREVQKLVDEYKRLGRETDELDKATGQNIDSFGQLKSALGSLAEVAAFTKALGMIKDMGSFALSTADTFQRVRNEFGTLLGDMEAGAGLFNRIKAFNDKTPFSLESLTQATNVLLSAKVPLSDLEAQLTKFGDLSQGNSQKMTSYVNAFSKASAKGKADMEVLNTYLNQGVPILDALAKRFNVTTAEIADMTSQGKISFNDFSAALDDLTAAGGRYFGGMELGSRSLEAMQEGLRESINSLAASFGEMLLPAAVDVVGILTDITNAINESPLLKSVFIAALVLAAGYLANLALQAAAAFARQMSLNFSFAALNPVLMAATIAVAALAAVYIDMASKAQAARREAEDMALAAYGQVNALNDAAAAARHYADEYGRMSGIDIASSIKDGERAVSSLERMIQSKKAALAELQNAPAVKPGTSPSGDAIAAVQRRVSEIKEAQAAVADLEKRLEAAEADLGARRQGFQDRNAVNTVTAPVDDSAAKAAANWRKQWAEQWERFQGEASGNPFAGVELERGKKLGEGRTYGADKQTINEINEYYNAQRTKIIEDLAGKERQMQVSLSKSKVDDLEYALEKEIKAIDTLEKQRIFAAGESEEAIAAIREEYAAMREETETQYEADIARTKFDEAKASVVDWRETLNDSLTMALLDMDGFSAQAAVILGDLSAQFLELSANAALGGFEEFGRALGEGKDAADSLQRALGAMAQQILKQLPMMFLQAGLQLIANGQWALGLGFIAASASTAIMSGYVDGVSKSASKNAAGGVYDEYGKAAAFAAGGVFTNRIVNEPTYFRFASGAGFAPGLMGEAGPEAIMPLRRGSDGRLGVSASGGGPSGAAVFIIIQNYSGEEVQTEEFSDSDGNQIRKIIIGMVKESISSGEMDRPMASRYGLRAQGV